MVVAAIPTQYLAPSKQFNISQNRNIKLINNTVKFKCLTDGHQRIQ